MTTSSTPSAPSDAASATDSSQVLRWVSESLRGLVRARIPQLSSESAVVFDSPAEIDAQGENRLSLFLYQIENSAFLANLPPTYTHLPPPGAGPNAMRMTPAPLVVDLVYMMVPYAKSAEMELVLVNGLVRLFHEVPALQGPWLHPGLIATGNDQISVTPRTSSLEALRDVWAGFPGKPYRLTKVYTVSPVRIPAGDAADVDMVTTSELTIVNTRPRSKQEMEAR